MYIKTNKVFFTLKKIMLGCLFFLTILIFQNNLSANTAENNAEKKEAKIKEIIDVEESAQEHPEEANNTTAQSVIVDLEKLPNTITSATDLFSMVSGVNIQETGGPGSYATLYIRGTSSKHLQVFLDGFPLSFFSQGNDNLAELPISSISKIEIYKGMTPFAFSSEAIGGAIHFISRMPKSSILSKFESTIGSFGYKHARLSTDWLKKNTSNAFTLSYKKTTGDFLYYNNQNTLYNGYDDTIETRTNNDFSIFELNYRNKKTINDTSNIYSMFSFYSKDQGVSNIGTSNPIIKARYASSWESFQFQWIYNPSKLSLNRYSNFQESFYNPKIDLLKNDDTKNSDGNLDYDKNNQKSNRNTLFTFNIQSQFIKRSSIFKDPIGEFTFIPNSQYTDSYYEYYLRPYITIIPSTILTFDTGSVFQIENYKNDNASFLRYKIGSGLQVGLYPFSSFYIQSSLLYSLIGNISLKDSSLENSIKNIHLLSPRFGSNLYILKKDNYSIKMSLNAGRFHRIPDFFELYGNQGSLIGNPSLLPESGNSWDTAIGVTFNKKYFDINLNAGVFDEYLDNLIYWKQYTYNTARMENISKAHLYGLEFDSKISYSNANKATISIDMQYTVLNAIDKSDTVFSKNKQLPYRPKHNIAAMFFLKTGFVELMYQSSLRLGTYFDSANLYPIPTRVFHNANIVILAKNLLSKLISSNNNALHNYKLISYLPSKVKFETRNIFNKFYEETYYSPTSQMISDTIGYPLPGRSFYITFSWIPKKDM